MNPSKREDNGMTNFHRYLWIGFFKRMKLMIKMGVQGV